MSSSLIPVVYSDEVNISFFGLEQYHVFDACKYRKIKEYLIEHDFLKEEDFTLGRICEEEELLSIHKREYLNSLLDSSTLSRILEFPVSWIPNWLLQWVLLTPMWWHVGCTIKGGEIAIKKGACIVLAGGMHHASFDNGGGWCVFSDISISIKNLVTMKKVKRVMVIDLDAHQGNGYERDKLAGIVTEREEDFFIIDVYNKNSFPHDTYAKKAINVKGEVNMFEDIPELRKKWDKKEPFCWDDHAAFGDDKYLKLVSDCLREGFSRFDPDIVYYNAGTDILKGDRVGHMDISEGTIMERDELVFDTCFKKKVPIVMVQSGGYAKENYKVIGRSIGNLIKKFKI